MRIFPANYLCRFCKWRNSWKFTGLDLKYYNYIFLCVCTVGMDDLHCGPHTVTLHAGSVTASVNIFIINDEDSECDETFTAQIIIGGEGNSNTKHFKLGQNPTTSSFRPGKKSSASIIVKDDEGDMGLLRHFLHYVTHSILQNIL